MSTAHLGDDAELYALGALETAERVAAERHLGECSACRERVAQAEGVAAALAATLPVNGSPVYDLSARRHRRSTGASPATWIAAAAALVIGGFGLLSWQDATLHRQRSDSDVALTAIVHGHFAHVGFTRTDDAAPNAKALYARDGSWLYVVVDRPVRMRLVDRRPRASDRDLGVTSSDGSVATLFVRDPGRLGRLVLLDDRGAERASADPKY